MCNGYFEFHEFVYFSHGEAELETVDANEDVEPEIVLQENQVINHGRIWTNVEVINVDLAADKRYARAAKFNWSVSEELDLLLPAERTPFDYVILMLPMQALANTITLTNINLSKTQVSPGLKSPINLGSLLKWIGIRLAMVLEPRRGGLAAYWQESDDLTTVYTAANFGKRFNMSKNRFEIIQQSLQFGESVSLHNGVEVYHRLHALCSSTCRAG